MSSAPTLPKKLAAELFGTFIFVLVGAGSALGTTSLAGPNSGAALLIAALANGLGLAVAVSATLKVSGGAINPAVAIGLWVSKKLPTRETILYVIAEIIGATAAGAALILSFPSALGNSVHWGAPTLSGMLSEWQGMAIEALITFVLVIAVYGTAVDARAPHIGGIGIGLALVADVLVAGSLTGAAANPARAFGPMLAAGFLPGYWYIYLVGPIVGGIFAGLVYHYLIESPNQ